MQDGESYRYQAFISYAHADEASARWLQKKLEAYRVPKRLRQEHPELPRRLYPVFRDRDELASGNDLSQAICDAMADAAALVVICSPAARASRWVNEEIRKFRNQANGQRIYCLIVNGSPERDSPQCAFPTALLKDEAGQPLPEPLAADLAQNADGTRGSLIKIAAGLLEVGVDDLRQRDAQRQVRFWSAVAAGSVAITLLTIGLAIMVYLAKQESELRRGQAENMIGFMLGDLREKLEPLGRLDLLDAVGDQATDYFAALGGHGSEEEIMARAMALRQIGEVRFSQGQLEPALEAFVESRKVASELSASDQQNEYFLFELGQAEFWVGYVAWERRDLDGADQAFKAYKAISDELYARDPGNEDYLLERLYAASNLGSVSLERGDPQAAANHFQDAIAINESMLVANPEDLALKHELAGSLSWLASAQMDAGELNAAQSTLLRCYTILEALHLSKARAKYSEDFGENTLILAQLQLHLGLVDKSMRHRQQGLSIFRELVLQDPENAHWQEGFQSARWRVAEIYLLQNRLQDAADLLKPSRESLLALLEADPTDLGLMQRLALVEVTLARLLLQQRNSIEAQAIARLALAHSQQSLAGGRAGNKHLREAAEVALHAGDVFSAGGQADAAMAAWDEALGVTLPATDNAPLTRALRASLYRRLEQQDTAEVLAQELHSLGFVDPRYQ